MLKLACRKYYFCIYVLAQMYRYIHFSIICNPLHLIIEPVNYIINFINNITAEVEPKTTYIQLKSE